MKTKLTKIIMSSLAFACALVAVSSLFSVQPAQAGYIVTLQQVGPDVVATGSGPIDLTGYLSWATAYQPMPRWSHRTAAFSRGQPA